MENNYKSKDSNNTNIDYDSSRSSCSKGRRYNKKLSKAEKGDLVQTLDHIVTAGATWERKMHRQRIFHANLKGNVDIRKSTNVVNLEDQRIYNDNGKDAMVKKMKYSNLRKRKYDKEMLWDEEHGDSIHPIAFLKSTLVKNKKRSSQNKEELSEPGGIMAEQERKQATIFHNPMAPLSSKEVPKAILIRCWQRAVHAASSTILVESGQPKEKEAAKTNDLHEATKQRFSNENINSECRDLKIALSKKEKICPSCKMSFSSPENCARHYYGIPSSAGISETENMVTAGCCLELLEKRRCGLIGESLEREVAAIIQQIGYLISTTASTKIREGQHLSWCDVLNSLNTIVAQSEQLKEEGNCNITKIQPNETQLPIVLNAAVMNTVHSRLVDRYANIPR